jgi:N,N'-diacetylchitobiose transport system permease protein
LDRDAVPAESTQARPDRADPPGSGVETLAAGSARSVESGAEVDTPAGVAGQVVGVGPAVGEGRARPVTPVAVGAGRPEPPPVRRRPRRRAVGGLPYGLLVPSLLLLFGLLGYPLYVLVRTSFQQLDLRQLVRRQTVWTGLDNYKTILSDSEFWSVTIRTLIFAAVCVALTIALGTLVALLMRRLGKGMRLLVSAGLLLAWATPPVSAATVFKWLFDEQYGVVDWLIAKLTPLDWAQHPWFNDQFSAFSVIILCVVWQAIPFVALTLYAGLTTVPDEILEAARIDGAGAVRAFRSVILPMLKPLYLILISLSVIWDLKVFTQVYVITRGGPDRKTLLINLYTYLEGFGASRFGVASAAAVVMVLITLLVTLWYVRSMIRVGEEDL